MHAQSCLTLCNPMDCSLPGFSVHGILQPRILEWVAISSSRGSSNPGIKPGSPALQVGSLPSESPGKHTCVDSVNMLIRITAAAKSLQSCPTLCDPIDNSPPGSPVPGILQARTLEWVAISSSRGSSNPGIKPGSPALQVGSLPSEPPGKHT